MRGIWRLRVSEATVAEIRRSCACDAFIVESVYFVVNLLLNWAPMEKLKQRCDEVSFTCVFVFFSMRRAAQFCMRRRLWTEEAGRPVRTELQ